MKSQVKEHDLIKDDTLLEQKTTFDWKHADFFHQVQDKKQKVTLNLQVQIIPWSQFHKSVSAPISQTSSPSTPHKEVHLQTADLKTDTLLYSPKPAHNVPVAHVVSPITIPISSSPTPDATHSIPAHVPEIVAPHTSVEMAPIEHSTVEQVPIVSEPTPYPVQQEVAPTYPDQPVYTPPVPDPVQQYTAPTQYPEQGMLPPSHHIRSTWVHYTANFV